MPKGDNHSVKVPPDTLAGIERIQDEFEAVLGFRPGVGDVIRFLVKHHPAVSLHSVTLDGVTEDEVTTQ
jgi:hypothetical protein